MIVFSIICIGVALFLEGFALSCHKNRSLEKRDGGTALYMAVLCTATAVAVIIVALFAGNLLRRITAGFAPFLGLVAALVPCFLVLSVALKDEYLQKDGRTNLFAVIKFYLPVIFAAFMCALALGIYGVTGVAVAVAAGTFLGIVSGLALNPDRGERLERTARFLAALGYFVAGVTLIVENTISTWQ